MAGKIKRSSFILLLIALMLINTEITLAFDPEQVPAAYSARETPKQDYSSPPFEQKRNELPAFNPEKSKEPFLKLTAQTDESSVPTTFLERQTDFLAKGIEIPKQAVTDLFTGSAGYNYPLSLPPGVNGLKPTLFLAYNHHSALTPTLFGSGWSLSNNQIIRNTEHTRSDTSDDTFILQLNGIASKLVYVQAEDRYHTETESYLYLQKKTGGNNDKKEYWEVKTKDGTTYRFGYNKDSELISSNSETYVMSWSLDQVTDADNNQIKYVYNEYIGLDTGMVYPDQITYGQNTIKFNYNTNLLKSRTLYLNGDKVTQYKIIETIETKNNNKLVKKYKFEYTSINNLQFLKSIKEYGTDGITALPEISFEYFPLLKGWQESNTWKIPSEAYFGNKTTDEGARLLDINGDGLTDLAKMDDSSSTLSYWINKGDGFEIKKTTPNYLSGGFVDNEGKEKGIRFADLNTDARIDLVQSSIGEINQKIMKINTGSGWTTPAYNLPEEVNFVEKVTQNVLIKDNSYYLPCTLKCSSSYPCGDEESINCDPESGECSMECYVYNCYLDNGDIIGKVCSKSKCPGIYDGYVTPVKKTNTKECDMDYVEDKTYGDVTYYKDSGYRLADVNGDGKTDLIKAAPADKKTWLGTETGWIISTDWTVPTAVSFATTDGYDQGFRVIDLNGDGLPDLVQAGQYSKNTWLNTGKGWTSTSSYNLPESAKFVSLSENEGTDLVDLNGDQLPDLIKSKGTTKYAWINTGTSWQLDSEWNVPEGVQLDDFSARLVDLNGDGLTDLAKANSSTEQKSWLNKGVKTYLLKKINENSGGKISFDYQKITSLDNTGQDSISDLPFGGWVVKSITYDNGMSGKNQILGTTDYTYSNGYYDAKEQEFRGFASAEEITPYNTKITHNYYQDEILKGNEYKTEVMLGAKHYQTQEKEFDSQTKNGYNLITLDKVKTSTYDGINNDPKISTSKYGYDSYGNPIFIYTAGESSTTSDDRYEHYEYTYNTNNWIVNKLKRYWLNNKNDNTKISETKFYYDNLNYGQAPSKGKLTKTESLISGNNYKIDTSTYDQYGNVLSQTDSLGHTTLYQYDASNTFPIKVTNAKGQIYQYSFDAGTGNLLLETDPNSLTTSYKYDIFGRNTKIILSYDSEDKPTVLYEYSLDGTTPEKITEKNREVSGTSNTYDTDYYFDGLGNLIQTKSDAENTQKQIVNDYYYDELNRLKEESNSYLTTKTASFTTPQDQAKTTYSYDPLSRITDIKNPAGTSKEITYLHYQVIVKDENDNSKEYWYNALGNIIKVRENEGNKIYETDYEYREDGNLLKITDDLENEFQFTYDNLGRLTQLNDPDLGLWTYTYDTEGNLLQQSANGKVITMQYDLLNRITKKTANGKTTTFNYDQNKIGTLSKVITPALTTEYQYDNRLRLINEKKIIDGITFENIYEYDALDRVTKVKSGGQDFTYTFNEQGKEDKIFLSGTEVIKNFDYNQYGQVTERQYKNNLNTIQNYNSQNFRLSSLTTSTLQDLSFGYDAIGNVLTIKDKANAQDYTMTYDDLDRLKSATKTGIKPFTVSYNYNSIGNMLDFTQDGEKYLFSYSGEPVHSPQSLSTPAIVVNEGCTYNNPACPADQNCVNNVCVKKTGCQYNNPSCKANENCVNNACVLKSGCQYNNPVCSANQECVNNACVLKKGCLYDNPSCKSGEECKNNQCIKIGSSCSIGDVGLLYCNNNDLNGIYQMYQNGDCSIEEVKILKCESNKLCKDGYCILKGCTNNNPACPADLNCMNNVCVQKTGCQYNNPSCKTNENCVNNACVPKNSSGCQPACGADYECKNNQCFKKSGCAYNNPSCNINENCVDNVCTPNNNRNKLPDLQISDPVKLVQTKKLPKQNLCEFTYEMSVKNIGDKTAKNITWAIANNKEEWIGLSGFWSIPEIKPGQESLVYPKFKEVNDGPFSFKVDFMNQIKELNEENNLGKAESDSCPYVNNLDLTLTLKLVTTKYIQPEHLCESTFELNIKNAGPGTANNVYWYALGASIIGEINNKDNPIPEIKSGYEYLVYPTLKYKENDDFFLVSVDPFDDIPETNENNNEGVFNIECPVKDNR